ncbi:MAG: ribbon-helix-helix protein, CopG family [Candidatus Humimicrobiaceae bacterium]
MVRVNISIGKEKLEKLDSIRKKKGISRSKLLREAADMYIDKYKKDQAQKKRREAIKQAIKTQDGLKNLSGEWDGVSEIRKWRESR